MSLYRINGTNGFIQLEDGVITVHRDDAGPTGLNTYRLDITKDTYPLGRLPRAESPFLSVMDKAPRKGEYLRHNPSKDPLSIAIPKTLADDEIIGFMQAVWEATTALRQEEAIHSENGIEKEAKNTEKEDTTSIPVNIVSSAKPKTALPLTFERSIPPVPAFNPQVHAKTPLTREEKHAKRHQEEVIPLDLPKPEVETAEPVEVKEKVTPVVAHKLPPIPRREETQSIPVVASSPREKIYGRQWFIDCESPYVREYVVVDIETTGLDEIDDRIIELAAIRYIDDVEVSRFSSFVRPYTPQLMAEYTFAEFEELAGTTGINYIEDPYITTLTGIDNHMLVDAPTADQIAPVFFDFIGNLPVIGHNFLEFDLKFLRQMASETKTRTSIGHDVIDTMKMAEVYAKDAGSRALTTVGLFLGAPETISHRALEDTVYTAYIYREMKKMASPAEIERFRIFNTDHLSHLTIVPNPDAKIHSTEFEGKNIVFTGTMKMYRGQAMQHVVNAGGKLMQSINDHTDYLVAADDNDTNNGLKLRKSFQQRQAGQTIILVQEKDFYELIGKGDYVQWKQSHTFVEEPVIENPSLEPAIAF